MLWTLVWTAFGAMAILGGLVVRRKVRDLHASERPRVDDAAIERILETGRLTVEDDPPLDLDEIEEAEDRFWSESWDEPETW